MKNKKIIIFLVACITLTIIVYVYNSVFLKPKNTQPDEELQNEKGIVTVKTSPNDSYLSNRKTAAIVSKLKVIDDQTPRDPLQDVMYSYYFTSKDGTVKSVKESLEKIKRFAASPHYSIEDKHLIDYYSQSLKELLSYSEIHGEINLNKRLRPPEKALAVELGKIIKLLSSQDQKLYDTGMRFVLQLPTVNTADYSKNITKLYDKMFELIEKREGAEIIYRNKKSEGEKAKGVSP